MQDGLRERGFDLGVTTSPVTPVFLKGGKDEAANIIIDLRENLNIFCSVVVYPVVPKDVIMLRIIPTAIHTKEDIEITLNAFSTVAEKLKTGAYLERKVVGA